MSAREWKPGDVAMVAGDVAIRVAYSGGQSDRAFVDGLGRHWRHEDDTARPLVVIDPEDREQVERLFSLWHGHPIDGLQAALREFATPTPPKPDEPQGLGAVVEDAKGLLWMRTLEAPAFHPWAPVGQISVDSGWRAYSNIDAVRVLSEGVTA